ncbi:MAG: sugar transporter permease [Clostridia bacterium]|jgi:multiple sugar transport system permease protein|nr:sugar transporter permease [Clostridia bacterium]
MSNSSVVSKIDNRNLKRRLTNTQKDNIFGMMLIIPAMLILGIVVFAPIIKGIWMSFNEYTIATMNNPTWNNFQNYKKLFESKEIFVYFKNTFIFVFFAVGTQFVIAMCIALLLNTKMKYTNVFRGLFLVSWTIPSVVVALLWSWMFQPQYGIINYILNALGLIQNANMQWVQSMKYGMVTVVIATIWKQTPYMIVMILAGLQSISKDYMEAAEIDGATKWQIFRHIMIPSIRPVLDSTVIIAIMSNFQMYTIIYNMTAGGPVNKTTTLSIAAYNKAFTEYDLGAGSAIGVLWLIVLASLTIYYNKKSDKRNNDTM